MVEPDEDTTTNDEEIDEDARPSKQDPNPDAIDEPTTSSEQEAEETAWMMKEGVSIGVVSILALLLVVVGAMQVTGLIDLVGPLGALGEVGAFVVLAGVVAAIFLWSRWGV